MALLQKDSKVTVYIPDLDNLKINGKIDFTNPEISASSRINLVRVSVPNQGNLLKPGMPVYVLVENKSRDGLSMPVDAVIRDGKSTTIWVKTAKNTFVNRMVETGLEYEDRIEITSGIKAGDEVVVSGAYLLNSEYIFKKGADPMAGHDMSTM
jgi:Cu(I)/Ag(I) efflux system membrane fusion protein